MGEGERGPIPSCFEEAGAGKASCGLQRVQRKEGRKARQRRCGRRCGQVLQGRHRVRFLLNSIPLFPPKRTENVLKAVVVQSADRRFPPLFHPSASFEANFNWFSMIDGRLFSSKGLFSSFALKTTQVAHPCFLPPSLIPFYFIPPVPPVQLLSFFGSPFPKRADERANIRPELRREDLSASAYPCLPVICLEWAWPGGTRSPPAMPSRLLYCLRRDVVRIGE